MRPREQPLIRSLDRPGDLGWVVMAHGELYAAEHGWDATFEGYVAGIVAEFAASQSPANRQASVRGGAQRAPGAGWIAEADGGERVGCVLCAAHPSDPATALLRTLLVHPSARGSGLGGALVDRALAFAAEHRYERMQLWTNDTLTAARRLYLERGFRLLSREPHHSFGVDLVGETYELELGAGRQP